MKPNKRVALAFRKLGMGGLVDSVHLRTLLGLPIRNGVLEETLTSSSPADPPCVSIIMPAYNVERYLENTIQSILRQSFVDFELIIVNDGSTDGTFNIAKNIAKTDPRIKLISIENSGPGAARNRGIRESTGEFLTFVDADDELPQSSLERRVEVLRAGKSDFVVGSFERFDSTRSWKPKWTDEAHGREITHITATELPHILWDVTLWNKLYRRSAWDQYVGQIPEGVLYEDQKPTARLFVEGATFDVIPDITYRWRRRDDLTSITQNKSSLEDLRHRMDAVEVVRQILDESGDVALRDYWYSKLLGEDLQYYSREVPNADEEFWEVLHAEAQVYLSHASATAVLDIPFDRRIKALALARANRDDFIKVLLYFQENGSSWRSEFTEPNGYITGWVPVLDDVSFTVNSEELRILPKNQQPSATLLSHTILADGSVELYGYIYAAGVPVDPNRTIQAYLQPRAPISLENRSGSSEQNEALTNNSIIIADQISDAQYKEAKAIELSVHKVESLEASIAVHDRYNGYSTAGFTLIIPEGISDGQNENLNDIPAKWSLKLDLSEWGYTWTEVPLNRSLQGTAGKLAAGEITDDGRRLRFRLKEQSLRVSMSREKFVLKDSVFNGNELTVTIANTTPTEPIASKLQLEFEGTPKIFGSVPLIELAPNMWQARVTVPALAPVMRANVDRYIMKVSDSLNLSDESAPVSASTAKARTRSDAGYGVAVTDDGLVAIERYAQFGVVGNFEVNSKDQSISFTGWYRIDPKQSRTTAPSFMLWQKQRTLHPTDVRFNAKTGEYFVEFSLVEQDIDGNFVQVPAGNYVFGLLTQAGRKLPASVGIVCESDFQNSLPIEHQTGQIRVRLQRKPDTGGVLVVIAAPFQLHERGPFAQKKLATAFRSKPTQIKSNAILFESFDGKSVSDSPKALDSAIAASGADVVRYWSVQSNNVAVPKGAIPLIRYSAAWYEALRTSKYLVNSNNFPPFFQKNDGQRYIQTWHGTPLKRIGKDIPTAHLSLSYRTLMAREASEHWDYLLAQSPWAETTLAQAFGFEGEMVTEGYPRNDALFGEGAGTRREHVRSFLGLSANQKVILYAPTWRDHARNATGAFMQPTYLDMHQLHKAFGRDVIVLLRAHSNTLNSPLTVNGPNVINVSDYPDINDLFLASDMLITDYSSVIFDYVNTGKPVVHLAPDFQEYRDTVRGFYFDLDTVAPGPIFTSTLEVVDYVRSIDSGSERFNTIYGMFKEKFAGLDDGQASDRVIKRVFSELM